MAARKRSTTQAAASGRARSRSRTREAGLRFVPSARSIVIGVVILVVAVGGYLVALTSSIFAVRSIAVVGGSPRVQAEVQKALAPELGTSLLHIDGNAIAQRTAALPDIVSVSYDRAFPHTLRIRIDAERAVMLVRQAKKTYVVSARGRVMRTVANPGKSSLPRVWVAKTEKLSVGETLSAADGALAAAALAPISAGAFPASIRTVRTTKDELTLVMRSGLEVRLGDIGDLRLKLAIAKRILHLAGTTPPSGSYIDVSVPERPVLGGINSQVAG